jgi:serine/threonine-protein kinase
MTDPATRLTAALEGRYRIERELGAGGMATVYLAEDVKHHRKVALKVLKPELAAVVGAERFLGEIETTANLQHPHILPLFDSGEADGFLYYVMPYIEGETLRDRLDRDKQLPVDEAIGVATAVAHALQAAHEQGVIHRDIKPGNILLSRGQALVADFGIGLAVGNAGAGRLTETGLSVGTPLYMSPEQATGDQLVGPASDIYALGCVLYESLVGDPPYSGRTAQAVLGKIIQGILVSATAARPAVPRNVDAAIRKALEKLPADRFARAADFAQALADPGFEHGKQDAIAGATARAGVWKPLALATTTSTLALVGVLGWSSSRPAPALPVERFESPFREDQAPVAPFGPAAYDLSTDGTMLVYRGPGPDGTGSQLWVRRWADLEAAPVRGTVSALSPSFSADGREIAFSQGDQIRAVALEGGPTRTLASPGSFPRWLADGFVYFNDVEGNALRVPGTGGPVDTVTAKREGESRNFITQLLLGGRAGFLTVQRFNLEPEVRLLDFSTGESERIGDASQAAYSPTGHIVFLSQNTVMAAPFDPDAMEFSDAAVPLVGGVQSFKLSASGSLAYFPDLTGEGANTELTWVTRAGEATPVEEGWRFDRGGGNFGWSLSPDGTRIAVRHRGQGGNNDIWIKEVPGGPFRRLTFGEEEQRVPFWTPDGARVTYFSTPAVNGGDVWWARADGTGQPELLLEASPGFAQGSWSPDGRSLVLRAAVFSTTGGNRPGARDLALFRPGVDQAAAPLLATAEYAEQDPRVSPDGRWLAYVSNETGRDEVFVRPFPEVDAAKVQVSAGGGFGPLWSRDGRELFYVDLAGNMVAVRLDASAEFRVTARDVLFAIPAEYVRGAGNSSIDIAPDGQRFLVGRSLTATGSEDEAPRMVLVKNFSEELRRRVPR